MFFVAGTVVSAAAHAQSNPGSQQSPPSSNTQQPAKRNPEQPAKPDSQGSNPFPEDTNSVPVLPSANSSGTPAPAESNPSEYENVPLPGDANDPVRSPDDAAPPANAQGYSSSSSGMDNLLKPPPDEENGKHRKLSSPDDTPHQANAKEDESVGSYYLDQKNWKGALSRFESALVLDPENPDVYWGLAEAQRHIGDFADAKANYLKVMEFDPDSRHSKDAKKILKEPEMADAKAVTNTAAPQ